MFTIFSEPDMIRFARLRKKTAEAIKRVLDDDPCCKSYEGTWEIEFSYPNYFNDPEATAPADFVEIRLHCYVLGPSRHYRWIGHSFEDALEKAECEVDSWVRYWRDE